MNIRKASAHIALLAMTASNLHAAGFSLYETSAKGVAVGGANVGYTGDASAVQVNPANMTQAPGTQTMFGMTGIIPGGSIDFGDSSGSQLKTECFMVPHTYATYQFLEDWWLGMGIYSDFGLGTDYDTDWPGRFNAIETSLETVTFSPTLAYKVTDDLSLGVGARIMYLDFSTRKAVARPAPPGTLMGYSTTCGDTMGYGWLAGATYNLTEDWTLGAVYRSRVRQHVTDGNVYYDSASPTPPYPPSDRVDAEAIIVLPSSATLGSNFKMLDNRLNLGTAVTWTEWSTYDALDINFARPLLNRPSSENMKDWNDAWRFGFGAEYALTEQWSLLGGYVFDMCPISEEQTDFMMPSGNRNIFSTGIGYQRENGFYATLSYAYLMMVENTRLVHNSYNNTDAYATFANMDAHMISASVGWNF